MFNMLKRKKAYVRHSDEELSGDMPVENCRMARGMWDACGCKKKKAKKPDVEKSCGFKAFLKEFMKCNKGMSKCDAIKKAKCAYAKLSDCEKEKYRKKGCCKPKCGEEEEEDDEDEDEEEEEEEDEGCVSCGFKAYLKSFMKKNPCMSPCEAKKKAKCKYDKMSECKKDKYRKKGCCPPKKKKC